MWVTAAVITPVRAVGLVYGLPAQRAALEITVSLVTLLAGFLVFGRLRRNSRLNDLVLAAALAIITLSDLLFVVFPILTGSVTSSRAVLAAIIGRSAGAVLFTAAAFVPRARIRQPGRAIALTTAGVLGVLAVAAVLARVSGSGPPLVITHTLDGRPHAAPALVAAEIVGALLTGIAAAGYLRRSERFGDEFSCWLAIAAVLAAGSHVSYALNPTIYSASVSLGDIFRSCCCVVLLVGSMREIQSYWRTLASAIVEDERRRIACDLHDGLSQELAYLTRNLAGLRGAADEKTLHQLQASVERARFATRQAIHRVAAPVRPAVADAFTAEAGEVTAPLRPVLVDAFTAEAGEVTAPLRPVLVDAFTAEAGEVTAPLRPVLTDALARAAGEVAERFGLNLKLDLASGIVMPPARADALVRIASEALTNVARHSGSRQVSLMLRRDGQRVRLRVCDSGHGFDRAARRDGFGLTSMRDRARSVGGDLRVSSEPGAGSQVEATL